MTDRGGWTEGVRFLEASGGPGSLVPTLTASSHRQCAPRRWRAEVRTLLGEGEGCCLEEEHIENRGSWNLTHRSLSLICNSSPCPAVQHPYTHQSIHPFSGPRASRRNEAPHCLQYFRQLFLGCLLHSIPLHGFPCHAVSSPGPRAVSSTDTVPSHKAGPESLNVA